MAAFKVRLECGHKVEWKEPPGDGGAPYRGLPLYCANCGVDQRIEECEPRQFGFETITLSAEEPRQSRSNYGGWQAGDQATIFYDTEEGAYGYCFNGIGEQGSYGESDDIIGFASADEAKDAAIADYQEMNTRALED